MMYFIKWLKNNKGVTLVEVLLAFTLSIMIIALAYGIFLTGMKTYNKIATEQALRDEADYVVSRIMQTFYETDIDDIKQCSPSPCIELHSIGDLKIDINENHHQVGIPNFNELKTERTITQIKVNSDHNIILEKYEATVDGNQVKMKDASSPLSTEVFNSDQFDFLLPTETEKGTEFTAICSYSTSILTNSEPKDSSLLIEKLVNKTCSDGIVNLSLVLKKKNDDESNQKLELTSQFGF